MSGNGILWSFVVPYPPLLPGHTELAPYNVVVVSLEEDPAIRLAGNVVPDPGRDQDPAHSAGANFDAGINKIDPEELTISAPVSAVFGCRQGPGGTTVTLPYWVLNERRRIQVSSRDLTARITGARCCRCHGLANFTTRVTNLPVSWKSVAWPSSGKITLFP